MTISSHICSPCHAVIEIGGIMIEMFGQKLTVQRFDDLRSDHGEIGTPAGSGKLVGKMFQILCHAASAASPMRRNVGRPSRRAAACCAVAPGLHWELRSGK